MLVRIPNNIEIELQFKMRSLQNSMMINEEVRRNDNYCYPKWHCDILRSCRKFVYLVRNLTIQLKFQFFSGVRFSK